MNATTITEQDITSLAHKLAGFVETLTPGEAAAFEVFETEMTTTLTARGTDVHGYTMTATTTTTAGTATTTTTRAEAWETILTTLTGTTTTTTV